MVRDFDRHRSDRRFARKLASVFALGLSLATPAYAAGLAQHVTITTLHLRRSLGEVVFVKLSAVPKGSAPCVVPGAPWHFSLPVSTEVGKKMLATLIVAHAQGTPVTLDGTGNCSEYGGIESMDGVVLES
jgi:hypothetical protein